MRRKKVLIFDFDGTIADSNALEHASILNAIHQYGHEDITEENIENYYGPTEPGIIKHILGEDLYPEALVLFFEDYVALQDTLMKTFPGMKEILSELSQNKDLTLILVTGRSRETLDISLNYLGFESFFKGTYTGSEDGINKDENILAILKDYDLEKDDVVYIGDSVADVKTMQGIDLDVISAGYSHTKESQDELDQLNPGNVAHTIDELKEKLDEITK